MATSLLVQSAATWAMDRFIPSSRQPQHWSRNYHGCQDRRRSKGRRRGSPDTQEKDASTYRQGVTLRAEDLLVDSEKKLGNPRAGDVRLGGSANELTTMGGQQQAVPPVRRSSEGGNWRRSSPSSSSSNAADDPTSSDPSSSCTTSSSTSSSESGCNGDSETCHYCRLSESSEGRESSSSSSTEDTPPKGNPRHATSEECCPPSRPLRRTSPREYLRRKRDQMDRLRKETRFPCSNKCDSDQRLNSTRASRRNREPSPEGSSPSLTFASPTMNHPVTSPPSPPRDEVHKHSKRNDIRSESQRERTFRSGVLWSGEESTPFLMRRGSFRCAVCDCDIPFTNCVLCSAEAKGTFLRESDSEVFITGGDLVGLASGAGGAELLLVESGEPVPTEQVRSEKKELEDFYDRLTPVETPSQPVQQQSTADEKRTRWTSGGGTQHKSFDREEEGRKGRRSSLRKYNSEPAPDTGEFHSEKEQRAESRAGYHVAKDSPRKESVVQTTTEDDNVPRKSSPVYLKPEFVFEPEIIHKANPLVDEADVDVAPGAVGAFRRLSEEEFISTLNIHEAARKGDLHVVKLLTKKDPKQMETVDERGWTPIHLAAAHGHTEVVKYLALEGAHLAALDPSSYTAIHLAAMNGHNSCLEVLLPLGVDVDSVTAEGFTALHLAVMNCHLECIQTLLQWGASLEKRDALGRGVHDMVEEYNLQDVAALLRRFHRQLHDFKHMLDIMNREGRNTSELMEILASIAEESGSE